MAHLLHRNPHHLCRRETLSSPKVVGSAKAALTRNGGGLRIKDKRKVIINIKMKDEV